MSKIKGTLFHRLLRKFLYRKGTFAFRQRVLYNKTSHISQDTGRMQKGKNIVLVYCENEQYCGSLGNNKKNMQYF